MSPAEIITQSILAIVAEQESQGPAEVYIQVYILFHLGCWLARLWPVYGMVDDPTPRLRPLAGDTVCTPQPHSIAPPSFSPALACSCFSHCVTINIAKYLWTCADLETNYCPPS